MHKIGVIGFSAADFDKNEARMLLRDQLEEKESEIDDDICVVSGLTALGVPKIAYELADEFGWKTVGVACAKAEDFDCYPVDEEYIVGDDWGDESEKFLSIVDEIIRIGGGEQTKAEASEAEGRGIPVQTTLLR